VAEATAVLHVELVFWAAIAVAGYAYVGYPALLLALVRLRPARPVAKAPITPSVSFIISAHNEERRICAKIENTLRSDYPEGSLEILVASDGSNDRTDALVSQYASSGVRLIRTGTRQGKEAAQKLAVEAARGEIVVFSDAGTELAPDGVRQIVMSFADPTVGCVSSVDALIDADGNVSGEGVYVRYEMLLRRLESALGSVVGLSGSFFAVRRSACREWAIDVQSDFNTLLNCVRMGLRGVSDEESVGYYRGVTRDAREFERKVRTVLRGITTLMRRAMLLDPLRYGLFAWQLVSHKLCRWLVPFAMLVALGANLVLLRSDAPVYRATLGLQLAFYVAAVGGLSSSGLGSRRVFKLAGFLLLVNASILTAWYRYWRGQRVLMWAPSER
jgi:glycosyltransferase involved in cell wall biosynthesis